MASPREVAKAIYLIDLYIVLDRRIFLCTNPCTITTSAKVSNTTRFPLVRAMPTESVLAKLQVFGQRIVDGRYPLTLTDHIYICAEFGVDITQAASTP